ncbi:type VI secretion system-associated protein TagF [Novosphingobium sp. PC22D]|uniref:type VI secretion system-associated protein TagF n=1 Tax=Novosphingobium sp. PC22D TaxID=1962403 RepID=UPI00143ABDB2|nr:type VI secretion system-associated protein TagF [Novosphingobium sp. PC22D]
MTAACLFGKLPAHGDFIARGMSASRKALLDGWMASSLARAQERFPADWSERFDRAAPWYFVAPAADGFEAGAISPSIDRAGRRFPVFASIIVPTCESAVPAAVHVLSCLYSAIAQGHGSDELMAQLERGPDAGLAPAIEAPAQLDAPQWWVVDVDGALVERIEGGHPSELFTLMLELTQDEDEDAAT